MRFKWDQKKSQKLKKDRRRRMGFEEVTELFNHDHYVDMRRDLPEQWFAIGWAKGRLMTVVFENREDREGEFVHLVTLWPSSSWERKLYEKNKT